MSKNIILGFLLLSVFPCTNNPQSYKSFSQGEFIIDPNPIYTPRNNQSEHSAVAFDGTNYLVVFDEYGASADIWGAIVSPDGIIIKQNIHISSAAALQNYPDVCFNGTNYFAVWEDWRSGGQTSDIYGARISTDGTVLDTGGIAISKHNNSENNPRVSSDGANFFAVWRDHRSGVKIYGARVGPSGNLIDTTGIKISDNLNVGDPKIEFDGTNFLIIWTQPSPSTEYDIYGARVSPGGTVIDTSAFGISTLPGNQLEPDLVFGGSNYLITFNCDLTGMGNSDIYAVRVAKTGSVLDPAGIKVAFNPDSIYGQQNEPGVSFDGTNYNIIFKLSDDNCYSVICGARISLEGQVLDPNGRLICPLSNMPELQDGYPDIAFDGNNYLVVWAHALREWMPYNFNIFGIRLSKEMIPLDAGILISSDGYSFNPQWDAAVAFDGQNYLVVWEDNRVEESGDIYGSIVSPDPQNQLNFIIPVSLAPGWQWAPAVAYGDSLYLAVWEDTRMGSGDIYGCRIKPNGEVLDPGGIRICGASNDQQYPSIAFGDDKFLVVWRDERTNNNFDIYAARVSQQGEVLDPNGILVSSLNDDDWCPSVAFDGTNYMIAWETPESDINGARVTPTGIVLDVNGFLISGAANYQEDPIIVFDGTNYLVVWDDERNGADDIYGARVTPAGTVLDPNGLPICMDAGEQEYPAAAFSGSNYLVTWDDYRDNEDTADVYGARIGTDGSLLNLTPLITGAGDQYYTTLAKGNGTQILIAYNGWTNEHQGFAVFKQHIWGRFVGDPTGINDNKNSIPEKFSLYQNYPNPFNPLTYLKYTLPNTSSVILRIYDVLGSEVITLVNEEEKAGEYEMAWDASDYPSGIYFYRLIAGNFIQTKKMVLLK